MTPAPLPPLREDLMLLPAAPTAEGAPSWTLHDPAANRYFRIGWLEFEVLQRWGLGRADAVAEAVARDTPIHIDAEDVEAVARFAETQDLIQRRSPADAAHLARKVAAQHLHPLKWLLKNYLFIRVPLVRPDGFLRATMPAVSLLFTRGFLWLLIAAALAGLFLILRQWDMFFQGLHGLATPQGAALAGGALMAAKLAHELGHAYAARRFGCRVPSMGVALMVLWPVLWTDTTEAWRLTDRRQRLLIDAGGVLAELILAAAASLTWSLLPDGAARTIALVLAGVAWVTTLAINLNPLMRFDGYFLLSDLLDEPNLQDRAFVLARWRLRELIFGFGDPPPEPLPAARRRVMIAYAATTWVYRFFLFLGIALLVYHFAFKLLGIILMMVELGWFIARPIAVELAVWMRRRQDLRWSPRSLAAAGFTGLAVAAMALPWRGEISAPALLRSTHQTVLYGVAPGLLAAAPAVNGARVAAGDVLFVIDSPALSHRIAQSQRSIQSLEQQIAALSVDAEAQEQIPLLYEELTKASATLAAQRDQAKRLTLRAQFDGEVSEIPDDLSPGALIADDEPLGLLRDPQSFLAEAYVAEADIARLRVGAKARFLAESGEIDMPLTLTAIDPAATTELTQPELASSHGGPVMVRARADSRMIPDQAVYRVLLTPIEPGFVPSQALRGSVSLEAERASLLQRLWRNAVGVFIRESGW